MGFTRVALFNDWIDDNIAAQWNVASGSAHSAGNWQNSFLPDSTDILGFSIDGTYSVNFSGANTYKKLLVRRGSVTLDFGGATQSANSQMLNGSVLIGRDSGDNASLTLTNGTLASVDAFIGRSSGATGSVTLNSGAQWNLSDSLYVGGSNTESGGAGSLTVNAGASLQVTGTLMISSSSSILTYNGGSISAGTWINSGSFLWTGGTIRGAGGLVNAGSMEISGTGTKLLDYSGTNSGQLTNQATLTHVGTATVTMQNQTTLRNEAGAVYDLQGDGGFSFQSTGTAPLPQIINEGTFRKSAGTGESVVGSGVLFNNTGTIEVTSGTLRFAGGYSHAAGTIRLQGGTFAATSTVTIENGSIEGSGTVAATVQNHGMISPGPCCLNPHRKRHSE